MSSRRGYLSQAELAEFADITITNTTEADDQISQAEEVIDNYVGAQPKFLEYELRGLVSAGGTTTLTLEDSHQNNMQKDFLKGCWIEIIGGTGEGSKRKITGQTFAGVITLESALTTDTSSYYRIWQLGKFPRKQDATFDGSHTPNTHYKSIPEAIRRAVAAQVEYRIQMGDAFFSGDKADLLAESIGDYSYEKNPGSVGDDRLVAPKAKVLLRGIMNRLGVIVD